MTQRPATHPPVPEPTGSEPTGSEPTDPEPSASESSVSRPAASGRTEWTVLWIWLAWVVATAMAVAVLVGIIGAVAVRATTDPTDGWRELAAFAAAVVLAVAGAALVGVVGAVLLVRRFAPRGRRAPVVGWTLGMLVVVVAITAASGVIVDLFVMVIAAGVVILTPVILIVVRERDRLRSTPAPSGRRRDAAPGPTTPGAVDPSIHPDGGSTPQR